ncbi:MAG: hypothetical protein ABI577_10575 [bacterium]
MEELQNPPDTAIEVVPGGGSESLVAELEASREAERVAVEKLRRALLATEPALEPAMVSGATVAEVEASFAAAQAVLTRLREMVTKETAGRIPAGAPGRAKSSARSPFEKIREGLANRE